MPKIFGIYFGTKKELTPAEKIQELMPHLKDFVPALREIMRETYDNQTFGLSPSTEGGVVGKLYDFFQDRGSTIPNAGYVTVNAAGAITGADQGYTPIPYQLYGAGVWEQQTNALPPIDAPVVKDGMVVKKDIQVKTKPIDVLEFLEHIPEPIQMEDLDTKIATCKDKVKLVWQHYAKEELENVVKCLEYRKVYKDHMAYFNKFPYTSSEKIDRLVTNYKLVIRKSDLFVSDFPKEAIDIMTEYTEKVREITGKEPNFYVIAEEEDFKKKYKKNDPILLVQSVFGFFWQILGAWDKELLLLSEL